MCDAGCESADGAKAVGVPQLLECGEALPTFVVDARLRIAKLIAHGIQIVDQ